MGRQIGSYQVISFLDAGGMGEVYRARDTRLNRVVAIKILPVHLAISRNAASGSSARRAPLPA